MAISMSMMSLLFIIINKQQKQKQKQFNWMLKASYLLPLSKNVPFIWRTGLQCQLLMSHDLKRLCFKLRLIQVTLFEVIQPSNLFTLCITNKYSQYNTSPFHLVNKIIDLKQCAPIEINMEETKNPLVKISVNACHDHSGFETQIDFKIIEAIVSRGRNKQAKKKRHILAFPLFGRSRSIVGQLKIKISIFQHVSELSYQNSQQKKPQRQVIFSQSQEEDYITPAFSRFIKVRLDDFPDEPEPEELSAIQQQESSSKTIEKRQLTRNDNFEPFKEEISLIEMRDSNSGRLNEPQEGQMTQFNIKPTNRRERQEEIEEITDIPEDCRYLFQKINQINKRYAPLQRIPSQQEFSEDTQSLSQGDCRIEPQLDLSGDEISHPLQQVEQLLKQLDLIKFAQTLNSEPSKS